MRRSNFHFVRQINEISVLKIIRDKGPISRSEVAREMGVSKVVIGGIVKRMLETSILRSAKDFQQIRVVDVPSC
jgi:DNA-binding MarR family transcriptional regulator